MMTPGKKNILYLSLSVVLAGIVLALYLYNKPMKDLAGTKPDFTMKALDITKEYLSGDSIADLKYLRKTIQIKGKIAEIQADSVHGIILTLDDPMAGVRCSMDKKMVPVELKTELTKGLEVTVKGACAGFDPIFGVVLTRCVLVKE